MASSTRDYYFVIVAHDDSPLFECEFSTNPNKKFRFYPTGFPVFQRESESHHLSQLIAHAALDLVDEQMMSQPAMQLKIVDKFNEWFVSAFVTASGIRMLMLHNVRNDDGIKNYFQEIYEVYVKYSMNPFSRRDRRINSTSFVAKAQQFGKKYLTG